MKYRKLLSLLTAAAVTASCMTGMLMTEASAEFTLTPITVTTDGGYSLSIADYLGSISGRTAKSLSKKIVFESETDRFAVRLSKKDLIAMRSDTVCTKYEFLITDDQDFRYKAVITQEDIPSDNSQIPENGISLALAFTPGTYEVKTESGKETVRCVDVKNTGSLGGVSVTYYFISEYFGKLMSAYGISTALDVDVLVPGKSSDGKTRYSLEKKISANSDAEITLTGDQTGNKRLAFDMYSEYYKKSAAEKLVTEELGKAVGYNEAELAKKAGVLENTVTGIKELLTNDYYSKEEIADIVKEYLGVSKNLKTLIGDILGEDLNKKAIYEAVYSVFGENTSSYQADKIAGSISDDLIGKLYAELIKDNEYITDTYGGRIKFFLNQYARDILTDLKKQVTEIQQKSGIDAQNIAQALEMLNTGRNNEHNEPEVLPDTTGTKQDTKETDNRSAADKSAYELAVDAGFKGTISEWFDQLADNRAYDLAVADGYNGTPDRWLSALAVSTAGSAYANAVSDGYKGSFEKWVSLITGTSESGSKTDDNNKTDESSRARDFYEWATETYGSIDNFMAEVANKVLENVSSGESAYEIAVRNGFTGTEQEWLRSLAGESAYEIAVRNGFVGTEQEWLESLRGKDGQDGQTVEESRVIYMYGYNQQAAPSNQSAGYSADAGDEITIDNSDDLNTPVTVITGNETQSDVQTVPTVGNTGANAVGNTAANTVGNTGANAVGNTAAPTAGKTRAANPTTGTAAAVLIPAAAVGAILLLKKDKRRRGKR